MQALVLLLDIHIVCDSLPSEPNGRFANLETELSDELQARCAGFVEAQIELYGEIVADNADPEVEVEPVEVEDDEEEDSDDNMAEKRRKKKANSKRADARKANKGKDKAAPAKTPAEVRAANTKKEQRLVAAGLFHRTIGAFVRAVHKGIVSLQHASVILTQYERFDATLDQWAKLLVQDLRDEGIYGDSGALVSRVIVDTLKGVRPSLSSGTFHTILTLQRGVNRPLRFSSTRSHPRTSASSPSRASSPVPSSSAALSSRS